MSANKELFMDLYEEQNAKIIFGNDSKVPIEGKGDVLEVVMDLFHKSTMFLV